MRKMEQSLVIDKKAEKVLSKNQLAFNSLVQRIDKLKTEITKVREQISIAEKRVAKEILPRNRVFSDLCFKRLVLIDNFYDQATKPQKKKLSEILQDEIGNLLSRNQISEEQELELKAIYDKYSQESYDDEAAAIQEENEKMFKTMMSQVFGVNLEDEDLTDPNTIEAKIEQQMEQKRQERTDAKAQKKKTKAQIAKEQKQKEEQKNIGQSCRKVYMELVKEFHPDTEPNEQERNRKTEVMKQITVAYQKNDLFELLKLQLEYLQINQENINNLADEKLRYYNSILKEQLEDLQIELSELKGTDSHPFAPPSFYYMYAGTEKVMDSKIKSIKKLYDQDIEELKMEIYILESEGNKAFASLLKAYTQIKY
jgi:galactitol-specific phosphotransferase system IIB component